MNTLFVTVRGECTISDVVETFAAIEGFADVATLYCDADNAGDDEIKGFLDYSLGLALTTGPEFIATCAWQILPNFERDIARTPYPECPPAGESAPLSFLTDAIEPSYSFNDGSLFTYLQYRETTKEPYRGAWCLNFDICDRGQFVEYMIKVTTAIESTEDYFEGLTITSFQTTTVACFESLRNPLTCSDKAISECDNIFLVDATVGSNEPFSIAYCGDECSTYPNSTLEVEKITSYYVREELCLPYDPNPVSTKYSSEVFQLETYCEADVSATFAKIRKTDKTAKCIKSKKSKAKAGKSPKGPKAEKSSKGSKSEKNKKNKERA